MPSFLRSEDDPAPSDTAAHGPRFQVEDPQQIRFDDAAYRDIVELQEALSDAKSVEDVVYTALELLGLALNYDVSVGSKHHRGSKRVFNLWR